MNAVLIGRLSGNMVLCYRELKPVLGLAERMRRVFGQLTPGSVQRQSYSDEESNGNMHYFISLGVVYMLATSKSISVVTAMNFLQSLAGLFSVRFSPNSISVATKEDAFASFIPEIERLVRDVNTRSAMVQLQTETQDIKNQVMQSVENILARGNKLGDVETQAADLLTRARDIMGDAKQMNREALWRQYSVFIVIGGILFMFILIKKLF